MVLPVCVGYGVVHVRIVPCAVRELCAISLLRGWIQKCVGWTGGSAQTCYGTGPTLGGGLCESPAVQILPQTTALTLYYSHVQRTILPSFGQREKSAIASRRAEYQATFGLVQIPTSGVGAFEEMYVGDVSARVRSVELELLEEEAFDTVKR